MGDFDLGFAGGQPRHSSMYHRNTFGSSTSTTSPPASAYRSDGYGSNAGQPGIASQMYGLSEPYERRGSLHPGNGHPPSLLASTSDPAVFMSDGKSTTSILIRRLPRNIGIEALKSMLLFAGDLVDTEFIQSPYTHDHGYATAVARFRSQTGAHEAQQQLHGKLNTAKEAVMIVESHSSGMPGSLERRATIDGMAQRHQTGSASSSSSNGTQQPEPGRSRFGSTFQSRDKISPPLPTPNSAGSGHDGHTSSSSHIQNLFSPQSPLGNGFKDPNRISGKSVINGDGSADEETRDLLQDPLAFAQSGRQLRRPTDPQIPLSRFGNLSLSTANGNYNNANNGIISPGLGNTSSREAPAMQSPLSPTNITNMGPNGISTNFPRSQYPPVNPADQNPPCNTLYVGNLPIDTSEDELKAIFSKQRGYKRLCFRTKQNGPMCFVEFEDVSFATKALNELYGQLLHNSVKGGIRLSFSKNPLGVRSGQPPNGYPGNPSFPTQHPAHQHALGASSYANSPMSASNFSAVSGPPPGLATPPGLANGNSGYRSPPSASGIDGMFANPFMPPPQQQAQQAAQTQNFNFNFSDQLGPRNLSGGLPPNMSGQYGRDARGSISGYMLGR